MEIMGNLIKNVLDLPDGVFESTVVSKINKNKEKMAANNINGNSAIIAGFDKAGARGGVVGSLAKSTKAMAASNTENYAGR